MPTFVYQVRDEKGKLMSGELRAKNQQDLDNYLKEKGYIPLMVKQKTALSSSSLFKKKIKIKDLAVFCRQLSIVLQAGLPLVNALDVLKEQIGNETLKEVLNEVYNNIQKGVSLSASMKQFGSFAFPDLLINMVEAGEVSGQLDRVFERMAEHFEKEYKLVHKIKQSITYPIIVCIVAVLVVFVLMVFVIPQFTDILKGMGADLPLYTTIMVAVSDFMAKYWFFILGGMIFLVFSVRSYYRSPSGRRMFSATAMKIPVVRDVARNIVTARFTRTLSTLIASGVLLIQALEVVKKVLGNVIIMERFDKLIDDVKKGKGLTQSIIEVDYFQPLVISMVRIGEESGQLDFALEKSADFFDQELETSMQQLTTMIEPAIIIVLAIVVGFILISVLFPMFTIYEKLSAM